MATQTTKLSKLKTSTKIIHIDEVVEGLPKIDEKHLAKPGDPNQIIELSDDIYSLKTPFVPTFPDEMPPPEEIPHELQLRTLYFLYDAFQRAMIDWFLIRQTAKDAMSEHQLTGDHIEIGVRKSEWITGKEILFMFFGEEHVKTLKEETDYNIFEYQDVPFTLRFYEDSEPLMALIPIQYEHETFLVPNQFERFEKEFDTRD